MKKITYWIGTLIVLGNFNFGTSRLTDFSSIDIIDNHSLEKHLTGDEGTPMVVAHGMGDACANSGMKQITKKVGEFAGNVYSVCIGDGDTQFTDTINGFLKNMNKQVDYFAKKVASDPRLKNGFDAMGLSQGNLLIRGYIEKYNNPPVRRFLSIHGPMAGVASLPRCNPSGLAGKICQKATDMVGDLAYSDSIQQQIAQTNYLKDPFEIEKYKASNIFLPFLNNEIDHADSEKYRTNFMSLERLVLVKALGDTMVYPHESEWFGFYQDGDDKVILQYNETDLYKSDAFGLKTLVSSGRVNFETSNGDHLRFSMEELERYVTQLTK